uniref:Uncharacterized protein LOC111101398 n=1 Tax=Crassostrea virginica TaxID=6565 RepID=A0A8B8ADP2_CRAVI|nr:uncharacterized protein LOC111101398 [Crassostrea virginica]
MSERTVIFVGYLLHLTKSVYFCNVRDRCGQAGYTQFHEPYVNDDMLTQYPQLLSYDTVYPVLRKGEQGISNKGTSTAEYRGSMTIRQTAEPDTKHSSGTFKTPYIIPKWFLDDYDILTQYPTLISRVYPVLRNDEQGTSTKGTSTASAEYRGPMSCRQTGVPYSKHSPGILQTLFANIIALLSLFFFFYLFFSGMYSLCCM